MAQDLHLGRPENLGRARCVGVSNWPWSRLQRFLDVTRATCHSSVVSYQRNPALPAREIWQER